MPSTMTFNQAAQLLNAIQQQATGQAALTAADLSEFVSAAQTTLRTGYDPVMQAISQVLSRTIFSIRPYRRRFGLAEVSDTAFGNHVRKLSPIDKPISEDDRYKWPVTYDANQSPPMGDGESVDMQTINKQRVLQTNFYGQNVWSDSYTIFRDQFDVAFTGPDELAQFISLITGNMANKVEQIREDIGRAVVLNSMLGTHAMDDEATSAFDLAHRTIPLLSLYNAQTGLSLTAQTVFQPDNFTPFVRWAFSIIMSVSDLMEERTSLFQTNLTTIDGRINRHTPKSRQKLWVASQAMNAIATMVRVQNFNDDFMRLPNGVRVESVGYWQAAKDPLNVSGTASFIDVDGAIETMAVTAGPVLAYLHDEEALGYATVNAWTAPAPFNARGGYVTNWLHETQKTYNDHTEKSVIFTLS